MLKLISWYVPTYELMIKQFRGKVRERVNIKETEEHLYSEVESWTANNIEFRFVPEIFSSFKIGCLVKCMKCSSGTETENKVVVEENCFRKGFSQRNWSLR